MARILGLCIKIVAFVYHVARAANDAVQVFYNCLPTGIRNASLTIRPVRGKGSWAGEARSGSGRQRAVPEAPPTPPVPANASSPPVFQTQAGNLLDTSPRQKSSLFPELRQLGASANSETPGRLCPFPAIWCRRGKSR